jgi:hypothetical protein
MNQPIPRHGVREWNEARRRAETYLRALHGGIGPTERTLLLDVLAKARRNYGTESSTPPVTLVMESLFDLLPPETAAPVAMTPPMQRVAMIPEKTEFPLHAAMRRLFNLKFFPSTTVC